MLRLALIAVLVSGWSFAALPVTTPEEIGKLVVVETFQTPASSTLVLRYTNDTPAPLRAVRLECTLLDEGGRVVDTDSLSIDAVAPGESVTRRLRIVDSSQRATRGECRIASARQFVP